MNWVSLIISNCILKEKKICRNYVSGVRLIGKGIIKKGLCANAMQPIVYWEAIVCCEV